MKGPVVSPDTGVLLAVGYGPESDPTAPAAAAAMALAKRESARIVVVSPVWAELRKKFDEIQEVFYALQGIQREIEATPALTSLEALEAATSKMRSVGAGRVGRYIDSVERRVAAAVSESPTKPLVALLAEILAAAVGVRELARLRVDALACESFETSGAEVEGLHSEVPGVHRNDWLNLQACQQLSESAGAPVIFLVLEGGLHGLRAEIRSRLPGVIVTNPYYLARHLKEAQSKP